MAIIKIRNTAIDLDAAEIPNLDASKITTGSLGTDRIPDLTASKITSGTFADARIASSNVSQHATSFDDNKIVNDISTLAIRQASNENKSAYNTNSTFVDVFQDSSKLGTLTQAERDTNLEKLRPRSTTATSSQIDYFNPLGSNNYTLRGSNSMTSALNSSAQDITSSTFQLVDPETARTTGTRGDYPTYFSSTGTDRWLRWDFQQNITFEDKLAFGKQDTYGDVKSIRLRHSTDGTNWTNFDWDDLIGNRVSTHNATDKSTTFDISTSSEGNASDGYVDMSKIYTNTASYGTTYSLYSGMPQITARYWEMQILALHSGTHNNNAAIGIFGPYYKPTTLNATGSVESTTITAPSSVSSMGAIITYANEVGTNTVNTDFVLKLSADNGSNYSTATLETMPDFSSGIKMLKVNDLAVTAGTQLKYKIEFANQSASKEVSIRGVSLQY